MGERNGLWPRTCSPASASERPGIEGSWRKTGPRRIQTTQPLRQPLRTLSKKRPSLSSFISSCNGQPLLKEEYTTSDSLVAGLPGLPMPRLIGAKSSLRCAAADPSRQFEGPNWEAPPNGLNLCSCSWRSCGVASVSLRAVDDWLWSLGWFSRFLHTHVACLNVVCHSK